MNRILPALGSAVLLAGTWWIITRSVYVGVVGFVVVAAMFITAKPDEPKRQIFSRALLGTVILAVVSLYMERALGRG